MNGNHIQPFYLSAIGPDRHGPIRPISWTLPVSLGKPALSAVWILTIILLGEPFALSRQRPASPKPY